MCCCVIHIGVPAEVPDVTVVLNANKNKSAHILSWEEPFNNFNPIVNYTVSCSGDVTCPPNFTTIDNTTRNHTITNLAPVTNYTFSVVATNSVGSGKAGLLMVFIFQGEIAPHDHTYTQLICTCTYLCTIFIIFLVKFYNFNMCIHVNCLGISK